MSSKDESPDESNVALEDLAHGHQINVPYVVTLHGELTSETSEECLQEFYSVGEVLQQIYEPKDSEKVEESEGNVHFLICTPGGDMHEMFGLYDAIRRLKEMCKVTTFGFGRVMSAGILLLASGTKGHRKVGKHTRLMLHSVHGAIQGSSKDIKNEQQESEVLENMYIDALLESSTMTKEEILQILHSSQNTYFSAEEAKEKGLVDIIV